MEEEHKLTAVGLMEEVRNKEDITRRTKELITNDCVLDKKRLRCVEHDCVLKGVNVSNQSGSGLKGNSNLVTKKPKKRNQKQPDMSVCQVQPMVSDSVDDETRTTVYNEERIDISGMMGTSSNYSGVRDGSNTVRK